MYVCYALLTYLCQLPCARAHCGTARYPHAHMPTLGGMYARALVPGAAVRPRPLQHGRMPDARQSMARRP